MATDDQKALQYIKRKYKTKTASQLFEVVQRLADTIKKDSQKESYSPRFKSEFSGEPESEAELAIK